MTTSPGEPPASTALTIPVAPMPPSLTVPVVTSRVPQSAQMAAEPAPVPGPGQVVVGTEGRGSRPCGRYGQGRPPRARTRRTRRPGHRPQAGLSQRADDRADRHRGPFEQGDRFAPVIGARPGLGPARRPVVRGGVREPGRAGRGHARRRYRDQPPGPAHFFGFLLAGEAVAVGEVLTLGVGAGVGATALAPLANP